VQTPPSSGSTWS